LTFLRSSSPVFVMISSMSVLICHDFHVIRANKVEKHLFKEGAHLSPLVHGDPLYPVVTKY